MKYLGCAYYPEYWGRERVEVDAKLMIEAGINIVRIGEFAWVRMEPKENGFTLDWLHECVGIFSEYGIDVILCTPTATPPAWLTFEYPDTLLMKSNGKRMEHGGRRHYCYTSAKYREHVQRIVEKLSSEFSKYKNVVAWQIDNEPDFNESGTCTCNECQSDFQKWLKQKYVTIDELNLKWGTGFWNMDYSDFRQVKLSVDDGGMSSRQLDTKRFASEKMSEFLIMQYDLIKKNHTEAIVSTNLNGSVFTNIDYYNLFSKFDLPFKDLYFDICKMDVNSMIMNQFRSFKSNSKFWITETGVGPCSNGKTSRKDQFKAWMWSSYAHGADAYVIFRWRTCLSGQEQELQGILEHSGFPGLRYKNVKEGFSEMNEISSILGDIPMPYAEVAIVHDYNVMWGYESLNSEFKVMDKEIKYESNFCQLHEELYKRNILSEIIPTDRDLSKYKLVILPSLMMISQDFAKKLSRFVESGGILFSQGQIGMRDFNNNHLGIRGPEYLQDLFGVYINGGMYLSSAIQPDRNWDCPSMVSLSLGGMFGKKQVKGNARIWVGDIEVNTGKAILNFFEDEYNGQAAIIEKQTGKGLSIYSACEKLDDSLMSELFEYTLNKAEIFTYRGLPEYVEIINRGDTIFIVNHRNEKISVQLDIKGKVLLGTFEDGFVKLKPYGVCVIKNITHIIK